METTTIPSRNAPTVSSIWYRRYGIAALLGGVLNVALVFVPNSVWVGTVGTVITLTQALATGLMLVGLYGLHRRYASRYGRVGLVVVALFGLGLVWVTAALPVQMIVSAFDPTFHRAEETWFFVTILTTLVASLYGLILWWKGILGFGGIVMAASVPVGVVLVVALDALIGDVGIAFNLPLGFAWAAVGYAMVRDQGEFPRP